MIISKSATPEDFRKEVIEEITKKQNMLRKQYFKAKPQKKAALLEAIGHLNSILSFLEMVEFRP